MIRGLSFSRRAAVTTAVAALLALSAYAVDAAAQAPATDTGGAAQAPPPPPAGPYVLNDSHLHLTNYAQEGTDIHDFLKIMGTKVGRVALFGLPLQQMWDYNNSGEFGPTYYLQSDSPLYYYSFTDAWIAMAYKSLTPSEQARFDPMITGFNPADMYAADHIRRVLTTFPGVFTGIGEFSIHKEFVSAKISGETASLTNPALDRILDFAAESGLAGGPGAPSGRCSSRPRPRRRLRAGRARRRRREGPPCFGSPAPRSS
jgi:hypothetical protein